MRKVTKLAVLTAALVALCSVTALAAYTWKQDGDTWYCYNSDGTQVFGEAIKSGNNYYYLDAGTGAMVRDTLVDAGDYKYYYGADGARVIGQWVKVAVDNDDDGWEYMYFQTVNGKAAANGNKTINSKKYYFSSEGYMLYGYRDSAWNSVDYPSAAAYYYGTKDDGSAQTGWVNITDGSDDNYSDYSNIFFYFSKGVKKYSTSSTINSKKYYFDANGKMFYGWNQTPSVADGEWTYYGDSNDGVLKKSQWVASDKDFGEGGEDGDTTYWYYVGSNGARYKNAVKKISSKYYLFDKYAHMKYGVVYGWTEDSLAATGFHYIGTFSSGSEYKAFPDTITVDGETKNTAIMYFSADSTDGSMKTGSQTVTIEGDDVTVYFDKHGYAVEGISSKKIYKNGVLQSAGDDKTAVKYLRKATTGYYGYNQYFLVNASGTILKNAKSVDADGNYWVTNGDYASENSYVIYKCKDKDYASYLATALRQGKGEGDSFTASSTTYYIHLDTSTVSSGYITADYSTVK